MKNNLPFLNVKALGPEPLACLSIYYQLPVSIIFLNINMLV